MIADVLRKITYQSMTSVHEIATITGRGESTVYRWINGESQPDFMSICKLANQLPSNEARQRLLDYFTQSMPVAITWAGDDLESAEDVKEPSLCRPIHSCVEALDNIADAMRLITRHGGGESLNQEQRLEATNLINLSIAALMRSRQFINNPEKANGNHNSNSHTPEPSIN